jgi:Zn-finger nucleic acid-binding protein
MITRKRKGDSPINCPRCDLALKLVTIKTFGKDVEIDICLKCRGSWYDRGELAVHIDNETVRNRLTNFPEVGEDSHISCPRCDGKMKLRHENEVEVDFCTSCRGVWLDLGEKDALRYQLEWEKHRETEDSARVSAFQAILADQYF